MDASRKESIGVALGRLPSALIICSCGTGERPWPFVASWVQQAAMEPAMISIAIQRGRQALSRIGADGGRFTLSILPEDGRQLMKPFFSVDTDNPFADLVTCEAPFGGSYLQDAVAWLECREFSRADAGDHYLIVAEVLAGGILQDKAPAIHLRPSGFQY